MTRATELPRDVAMKTLLPVALADNGDYFKATNPTPGTGIAQGVLAAYDAAKGLFCLSNPAGSDELIYPDYLRLIPTVVPASATRGELVVVTDPTDRYASGGSKLPPLNANQDAHGASQARIRFGTLVLNAASGGQRILARAQLRNAILVAFEELLIRFGSLDHTEGTLGGTTGVGRMVNVGPVVIGPGHSMAVQSWYPSNATTGASFECEFGFFRRDRR